MKHDTVNDRKDKRMNALNVEEEKKKKKKKLLFISQNAIERKNALDFLKKNRETPPRAPLFF